MKNTLIVSFSLAALAMLGACSQSDNTVHGGNGASADPMAEELANAPVAALPPSLKSSKTYRCKSSGLVKVEFFDDDLTANVTPDGAKAPVHLTAAEKGKAYEGEGYKVEGTVSPITVTLPGKSAESCKA
ncbi:hypothetical protein LWE61_00510 [Sphingobium sufflavum]|uniref:hypothetical protein n=1 Tax=Sphingobium sufflavum TaxID=1129547 RepID=UPI001F1C3827|nr:hypothetical protein [Sphingobium sufflavum]MCE7795030.1 hypothetical protein [Sphingobium sufflavum]